ncbi:hypothetical protein CKO35_05445 [Ectothiorhodospira shaposhnikovii]|uniref:GNAT family N-acetyltransferase n=1 Tax=Ectothiorhodospira shaposhnikovii TaxID=1054 RepID=UPI0019055713|nr:N-acetyltransferase [Ectothiorhodospira shaposhnikovii]MBK1672752.1 hypothetical protein [Ectothiorhodospira shaposhnikovii]
MILEPLFSRLKERIRLLGWADGLLSLLASACGKLTGSWLRIVKYHLMVQPVTDKPLLPCRRGGKIQVREVLPSDLPLFQLSARDPAVIACRFERGGRCLVATINERFAGFLWFQKGDYLEDEVRCRFRPLPVQSAVWDYDVYVEPACRLSPVFLKLWQSAGQILTSEGVKYSCSRISAFNPVSITSHQRMGARAVGSCLFICLGQWQCMISSHSSRIHFNFGRDSVPLVAVECSV